MLMRWHVFHDLNATAHFVSNAINSFVRLLLAETVSGLVYRGESYGFGEASVVV